MRRCVDKYVQEYDESYRMKQGIECNSSLGEVVEPTYPFEISRMGICGP
jgi:hypothetical protein